MLRIGEEQEFSGTYILHWEVTRFERRTHSGRRAEQAKQEGETGGLESSSGSSLITFRSAKVGRNIAGMTAVDAPCNPLQPFQQGIISAELGR